METYVVKKSSRHSTYSGPGDTNGFKKPKNGYPNNKNGFKNHKNHSKKSKFRDCATVGDTSYSVKDNRSMDSNVILFQCRTIRIGSYKCMPLDEVTISRDIIRVAIRTKDNLAVTLRLKCKSIAKFLVHFGKALPIIFIYMTALAGTEVRRLLNMKDEEVEPDYYFNPAASKDGIFRRIVLIPIDLSVDDSNLFKKFFPGKIDELSQTDANEILMRACGELNKLPHKERSLHPEERQSTLSASSSTRHETRSSNRHSNAVNHSIHNENAKQLLKYPNTGQGSLPITVDDYACLATDQFLNDVIIDFYLKYLLLNHLSENQRSKFHVFSTFFYKRLTQKPQSKSRMTQDFETDPSLTPAQRRHLRVARWTKKMNIFEKDYIVVPINESSHWFLAIICFPNLGGPRRLLDDKPIDLNIKVPPVKAKRAGRSKENIISVAPDDGEFSDRDEAEGSDSDLEQDSDEDANEEARRNSKSLLTNSKKEIEVSPTAIKQPCILIFDSLQTGAQRSRVVATLRDYLTWEHREKYQSLITFDKHNMRGHCPKVPQQNNFTDCGLYVLQYVETFILDPIRDYNIPIKHLKDWFDEITVTKKREDIANLIKRLMIQYGNDLRYVPNIQFPTRNGILLEDCSDHDMDEEEMEPDEEEMDDEFDEEGEHEEEEFDEEFSARAWFRSRHRSQIEEEEEEEIDTEEEEELLLRHHLGEEEIMDEEMPNPVAQNRTAIPVNIKTKLKAKAKKSPKKLVVQSGEASSSSQGGNDDTAVEPLNDSDETKSAAAAECSGGDGSGDSSNKNSNRDTMLYLKTKRINRHKNCDSVIENPTTSQNKRQKMDVD